jgi:hypothetical protein
VEEPGAKKLTGVYENTHGLDAKKERLLGEGREAT